MPDVYQEVFLHLWDHDCERLRQWRGYGSGKFSSYLITVISHLAYDYHRRGRRRQLQEASTAAKTCFTLFEIDDMVDLIEQRLAIGEIEEALTRLSARDNDILRQRYWQFSTYSEMSREMSMPVGSIGVAVFRAGARLRRQMASSQARSENSLQHGSRVV